MSSFTTPLIVEPLDGDRPTWVLVRPFEYHVGTFPSAEVIRVPALFQTDFASIPRVLWMLLPPWHPHYGKAAVIHDWLWVHACSTDDRRRAAAIFAEGLEVLGCPPWKRQLMAGAVRLYAEVAR